MKFLRFLSFILLVIVGLAALAFAFIEIRSLVAGDFTLMQNPTNSAIGYAARGVFYVAMLLCVVWLFGNKIIKKRTTINLLILSILVAASSITLFFFYIPIIAIVVLGLNILMLLVSIVRLIIV